MKKIYILLTGVGVFIIFGLIYINFTKKTPVISPSFNLEIQISNRAINQKASCVISQTEIALERITGDKYGFCSSTPHKPTCLYLKAHNRIYLRSNENVSDCSKIKLEKSCFIVDSHYLTCKQQILP